MKRTANHDQLSVEPDVDGSVEVWEPDEGHVARAYRSRGSRARLTASVPGAVAGVFLVCALVFGASLGATGSHGPDSDGTTAGETTDGTTADEAPTAFCHLIADLCSPGGRLAVSGAGDLRSRPYSPVNRGGRFSMNAAMPSA
jgi:hypothetical protein